MTALKSEAWQAESEKISAFLKSQTEKIHLVIGAEEAGLYRFFRHITSRAAEDKEHLVFGYEFWAEEHHPSRLEVGVNVFV